MKYLKVLEVLVEVRLWPRSQEKMDDEDWFPIANNGTIESAFGDCAYGRIVMKGTKEDFIIAHDPGDEHMGKYLDIDKPTEKRDAKRRKQNRLKASRRTSPCDRRK